MLNSGDTISESMDGPPTLKLKVQSLVGMESAPEPSITVPPAAARPSRDKALRIPLIERKHLESPNADPKSDLIRSGHPLPLDQRGIEHILMDVYRGHLTGRLEVASSGTLRRIFFDEGAPSYADSSAPTEDLAAYLAAEGMVVPDVLE
jgi:hypothetical protein